MHPTTRRLRHQTVIPGQGQVADVDVESGLQEDGVGGLQMGSTGPEPGIYQDENVNILLIF